MENVSKTVCNGLMKKSMVKFNQEFLENYYEDSDKGYVPEINVKYPNDFHAFRSGSRFLPEKMKVNKCKKLVCNLYDKKKFKYIRTLKQLINHRLTFKKYTE